MQRQILGPVLVILLAAAALLVGCSESGDDSGGGGSGGSPVGLGAPGCSKQPDCARCAGCLDSCVCETGQAQTCGSACGGGAGGSGASGTGGSAGAGGAGTVDAGPGARPYPDPAAHPPNRGPGGPTRTFTQSELYQNCAFLKGGPLDTSDHHNLVVMLDGYLLMPWAPEYGGGGLSFYDFTNPCAPVLVGTEYSDRMRESHSIGFSTVSGRRYAVVNQITARDTKGAGGIQFWDVTDPLAPVPVADLEISDFFYPDAYKRVVLSVFWQGKYVYAAAGDTGLVIVDASDPTSPRFVKTYPWNPVLSAGQVHAIGNLLVVTAASIGRTALLDIADPENPQPIPGGEFSAALGLHYFSNFAGGRIYYTRNFGIGGGLAAYDVSNPSAPVEIGNLSTSGAGGYVFVKDHLAFTGQSDFFAIYDITDHANIVEVGRLGLQGDQDTMTPIGNVAVLSVDDNAPLQGGTAIAPWSTEVDSKGPSVTWTWPSDGATGVPPGSRIGMTFSEMVDVNSAWTGSIRLYQTGTAPGDTRVDGDFNVQENIVNLTPLAPLLPGTSYTIDVPAGGVADYNGNRTVSGFVATFTTGN